MILKVKVIHLAVVVSVVLSKYHQNQFIYNEVTPILPKFNNMSYIDYATC
jgi:hypothetical protein